MKRNRSLTLIELLIATSIFVTVTMTLYSAIHSGIFGYRNIEDSIEIYETARSIMERLNLDLRNCFAYKDKEGITKFSGNDKELNFLATVAAFSNDKIDRDFAFISYTLDANRLMRLCRRNSEALREASVIQPQELASHIKEMNFKYLCFDPQGPKDPKEKTVIEKDSWALTSEDEKKTLPLAVHISLTVQGKVEKKFERIIYLLAAEVK